MIQILKEFYDNQYNKFKSNPKLADQVFKNGRKIRNRSLDKCALGALLSPGGPEKQKQQNNENI